ncbi:MAG: dTDP-4-dehydrorhamnose reductase [Flavobacteriales bacterium]
MAEQTPANSSYRKVLVTGANGQLGSRLTELGQKPGLHWVGYGRPELDITDEERVGKVLDRERPDVLVNAAAYTAVDRAEEEPKLAHQINAIGPAVLAKACAERGIPFIHISTDYVFDGAQHRAYLVADEPNPQGVYARSKRAGELNVEKAFERCREASWWIIRVAWLYDVRGKNFFRTMVQLGESGKSLRVVDDQFGAPNAARPFASTIERLIQNLETVPSGYWHYSTEGPTSWFEFAKAIFALKGLEVDLRPCTSADYPTAAPRPKFSYLDGQYFAEVLRVERVHWEQELEQELKEN